MYLKTLLLSMNYEVLSFISEKKLFKLLSKENKVEVISCWDITVRWASGSMQHPAIVRLKNPIKKIYHKGNFSRRAIIKRDHSKCQYCEKKLNNNQITIDHVIPKFLGGTSTFINCVVACRNCNLQKGNKTPEQANMQLINKPIHPYHLTANFVSDVNVAGPKEHWHQDWKDFLNSL